ncbi:MAG: hypothetical protein AMJ43_06020 [Coxiella sp. DG_40]|nr:MAG: hypothetical protein AMJ43_06020 [Coxiella sp. DG_40]
MRIFIVLLTVLFFAVICPPSLAKSVVSKAVQAEPSKQIILYAEPDLRANVVAKLDVLQHLVPIYRKESWLKVGNPADGQVGWIDINQYRQLMTKLYKPETKSVFIRSISETGKSPKREVIAYENGKQLDKKQAEELLKNMQRQQLIMERRIEQMQNEMNKMFTNLMKEFPIPSM